MSRLLELPDPVYRALSKAASASGLTPAAWIAAQLSPPAEPAPNGDSPRTLAERFAGRVGRIAGGTRERGTEDSSASFAEHLEAKRRAGRL